MTKRNRVIGKRGIGYKGIRRNFLITLCPIPLYLIIIFSLFSCEKGTPIGNLPPETRIFLDEIRLTGENRLNSVVRLHWSGEDQDGYVTGYDLSLDGESWTFVEVQDSLFRFDLGANSDTADIDFYVRAIDNEETVDPTPAYLRVPIKNTPPVAKFDTVNLIPDTVFSVYSVIWFIDDLDGVETIDSIFLRINDGAWTAIERETNFATFVPESPMTEGVQNAKMFRNFRGIFQDIAIPGLKVGADNRMYLRARDITGSFSEVDSTKSFFIRTQGSDLLVIDVQVNDDVDTAYFPMLDQVYTPGYDYLDLANNIPIFWDPTFGEFLKLYDKVFWYSDGNINNSITDQLLMEVAANQIQQFLNQGGKLLITSKFPNRFSDPETADASPIFGFSPVQSFSTSPGQARIPKDSAMIPVGDFVNVFEPLVSNSFISGADPFVPKDPANAVFNAPIIAINGWTGPSTICARSVFSNGRTNQFFFSVELNKLEGSTPADSVAFRQFFDKVLNQEFNW